MGSAPAYRPANPGSDSTDKRADERADNSAEFSPDNSADKRADERADNSAEFSPDNSADKRAVERADNSAEFSPDNSADSCAVEPADCIYRADGRADVANERTDKCAHTADAARSRQPSQQLLSGCRGECRLLSCASTHRRKQQPRRP